jgi:ERCC4-type nuclease
MMIIKIIIDSRENKLFGILKERDLDNYKDKIIIEKEQLDVGDIHIIFNEITYIYERKTVSDLLSSIKDGRYKEQKIRLLASCRNNNYIIEGDCIISNKDYRNQKILTSVYLNSIYRDNINVFFTNDINDTATFILLLACKIIDKPENYLNKSDGTICNYLDNCKIKTKKICNIDKDNCYLMQLSQIPGISIEIARKIKDIYSTLPILIKSLQELNDKKLQLNLLMEIDKIGKQKALNIIEYLCI